MTALFDALSVVDFITTFGASIEAPALSLLDVQQMAAFPLDTPLLGQCYVALLRCLLREAVCSPCPCFLTFTAENWTATLYLVFMLA